MGAPPRGWPEKGDIDVRMIFILLAVVLFACSPSKAPPAAEDVTMPADAPVTECPPCADCLAISCPACEEPLPCPACPTCPACEKPDAVCTTGAVMIAGDTRFAVRTLLRRNGSWYEVAGISQFGPLEMTTAADAEYGRIGDPVIARLQAYPAFVGRIQIGEFVYEQLGKTISRFQEGTLEGGGSGVILAGCSLLP